MTLVGFEAQIFLLLIGYAAWKGKLKSLDRERYGLSAVSIGFLVSL